MALDFTPMYTAIFEMVSQVVIALSAVAGILMTVVFSLWSLKQIISSFGYDELGRIVRSRDKKAYRKYQEAHVQKREYEREYSSYAKKRKKREDFEARYSRENRSFFDLNEHDRPRKHRKPSRGRYNENFDDYDDD